MGVGKIAIALYEGLYSLGVLRPGQSMIEMGSQETTTNSILLARIANLLNVRDVSHDGSSRMLMTKLGFVDYQCIDLDGKFGAWRWNLNEPQTAPRQWDVVTNHGMTEHIFNQFESFRLIHDLCKDNGVMIHCLPMSGYEGHCLFQYTKTFFEELAAANDYHIWHLGSGVDSEYTKKHIAMLSAVALGKRGDAAFRSPIQELYR